MENSLKGLILAAGVIITCIVIGLGFYISREARDTAAGGAGQISKLNAEFNESDKSMYDGLEVSGSEVINVINKFKNEDVCIEVKTKKSTVQYCRSMSSNSDGSYELGSATTSNTKNAQDINHVNYVNPNAQFSGTVLRDANNAIIGINFVQQ